MSVKAFEFVPVIETLQFMGDKAQTKIECIECCGKELYIGTSDSFLVMYNVEEKHEGNGKVSFKTRKTKHKFLELRKPVKCIKAASALSRILILCDSSLLILNMHDLDIIGGGPKLKDISTFGVNENPNITNPFCIQICVGRKRMLQIYNVTEEKLMLVRDISVPEILVGVAVDGSHICAALQTQYAVYNFESSFSQKLFTYGSENFHPVIRRIAKEEFLLSAPEGLGMFVNTEGMSNRPPIQWSYSLLALAYSHPYILGLSNEIIMIYSILDQQQKQALPFTGGRNIGNFDGRLYVTSGTAVYSLIPVPWEKQVEMLLADGRVEEALELAQNSNHIGMTKEQFQKIYNKIQQQSGFIYFSNGDFDKAHELFESGAVDPREVISVFPNLLPPSSAFIRTVPPLHEIADINQLYHGDEEKLIEAKQFLRHFLEDLRESSSVNHSLEIDTALLKLYAEVNAPELEAFIAAGEIIVDVRDCCEWLEKSKCFHALALLHRHAQDHDKALKVWAKIITDEYEDESFHGLEFFVECLANLKEPELMWRYADFVLSRDEEIGVGIFTLRSTSQPDSDTMKPDTIVDYLHQYPKAVVKYLEHLVLNQNIKAEKFHTHLAVLYLENILRKQKEGNDDEALQLRMKLRHLLQISDLYRVQLLLSKISDADLHQETAILYGKIEEHEKALDILVHKLKDFKGAEQYCINNTKDRGVKYKHNLFHTLLGVYLDPKLKPDRREEYLLPALEFLNACAGEFDAAKVLEMIPSNWSISVVEAFLRGALRTSLHKTMKALEGCILCPLKDETYIHRVVFLRPGQCKHHTEWIYGRAYSALGMEEQLDSLSVESRLTHTLLNFLVNAEYVHPYPLSILFTLVDQLSLENITYRMTKIQSALARGENLRNRFALYDLQRHSVCLHENNYCCVCKKPFSDGNFARYPNDVVTHISCARHSNICPLTGKNFKNLTSLYAWR